MLETNSTTGTNFPMAAASFWLPQSQKLEPPRTALQKAPQESTAQ